MNREQKKAFRWMQRLHRHGKAAVASFLLTGDRTRLQQAVTSDQTIDERVGPMVEALAGMALDRRQALLARMSAHMEKATEAPAPTGG